MEELYHELFTSTARLYNLFNSPNFAACQMLLKQEEEFYEDLNYKALYELNHIINLQEQMVGSEEYENFELAMYDNMIHLILRRMGNMVYKYIGRCQEVFVPTQAIKLDNYKTLQTKNVEGSLNELYRKLYSIIETKFLYFVLQYKNISYPTKGTLFSNMMFVDPFLQEKIYSDKIMLEPFIKNEDSLYENLWDNVKNIYLKELYNCCIFYVKVTTDIMVLDEEDEEKTLIREAYLRSLFNFLDEETLEELDYDFNSEDYDIKNDFGYDRVRNAFRLIRKDKKTISEIKEK